MKPPPELGPTLTTMQVSAALGIPARTVRDYLASGRLEGFQFGRNSPWLIPTSVVAELARRSHLHPDWRAALELAAPAAPATPAK